jgi:hypothetical protein
MCCVPGRCSGMALFDDTTIYTVNARGSPKGTSACCQSLSAWSVHVAHLEAHPPAGEKTELGSVEMSRDRLKQVHVNGSGSMSFGLSEGDD